MPLGLQVFDHEPKYWTDPNFTLMVGLEERRDHSSYYRTFRGNDSIVFEIFYSNMQYMSTSWWH